MSIEYNDYIVKHKKNVMDAFNWLSSKSFIDTDQYLDIIKCINEHDNSKYEAIEYDAYDRYFYGGNQSYQVCQDFELAFLYHLHRNPHHWQYWILINDGGEEHKEVVFEMPYKYVIEMICDWWSFSWKDGDLSKIFDWYESKKDQIRLNENTRTLVEDILEKIKSILKSEDVDYLIENGFEYYYDSFSCTWRLINKNPEVVISEDTKNNIISKLKEKHGDYINIVFSD